MSERYIVEDLERVQFFANSVNRLSVFEAFADGSATGARLAEETDASRSTVARILNEGEKRGWVDSRGSRYELTPSGELMTEEFSEYLDTVDVIRHLGAALDYLPEPAQEVDVRCLRDARITEPTETRPNAHYSRALELYETADSYRGLTRVGPDVAVRKLAEEVEAGELEMEAVIASEFVDGLRDDPKRAAPWYVFADRLRVYDGTVPLNMHIIDGTVVLWLSTTAGDEWETYGLLECDHPAVVEWAESLYRDYRTEATPFDTGSLPPR